MFVFLLYAVLQVGGGGFLLLLLLFYFCCVKNTSAFFFFSVPFSEVLLKYVFVIILTVRLLATAATAVVAVS